MTLISPRVQAIDLNQRSVRGMSSQIRTAHWQEGASWERLDS